MKSRDLDQWSYVPLLVLYGCNSRQNKDISAVRNGVALRRPFVICLVTGYDNVSRLMAGEWSLGEMKMIREGIVRTARNIVASMKDQNE